MNIQENIIRVKELMGIINEEVVYDYEEGRNTAQDRFPFDLQKLVDVGAVFVTPAIQGDETKNNYKQWLKSKGSHLITLYNIENSSPDSWIHKAITRRADISGWGNNFVDKLYDGKYNQILWSLKKLGVDPNDMLLNDESKDEIGEYSRTLKNARKQGIGLRFPKSAIKANPRRFRFYTREKEK